MATGTGKTVVAFQICWKLWTARWNRTGEYRRPKILYLADRNILVDQPKDGIFAAFGDARYKIESGEIVKSREMYFAIYQALAEDERRTGLFKAFAPDFFDLVIVDECHRGSARDDSSWRVILDYFTPAVQFGMTATPLRNDNRDTYLYFGNPIYEYSLRQGIDDGFLAPYRVHRVISEWDATGWRPSKHELDRYGRVIPDDEYQTKDFERAVALRARTEAIAKHLTGFLKKTDRFAKTIVFCVDQEHASDMRQVLSNLNADLVVQHPDYVCRVTADEGDIGRGHLSRFQDVDTNVPTILTTSQLLTTGVDAPTCKNIVLARVVESMSEFKQIIGRGTRVRDDYGKLWFNILDYTGSATHLFADPAFDGDPARLTEEELKDNGETTIINEATTNEAVHEDMLSLIQEPPSEQRRKYYFDGGQVEIAAHLVIEPPYRWRDWAARVDGITGDELLTFINNEEGIRPDGSKGAGLFAYLRKLTSSNGDDRRDVIATVFGGVDNRMKSGYLLRAVINKICSIHFTSSDELHTLGALYESLLREMRDAVGDSGEFYTPRAVVRFMVAVVNPRLGETVLRCVKKGQFIYSRLFAFEGAYGMVSLDFDGHFVSNEYPTFDCDPTYVRVEFVTAYFRSPKIWKDVAVGSKGLGDRRQRVQPSQVLSHKLWVPPIAWQNKIAEVQDKVDALKRLQAETATELDALLPAVLDKAFRGGL
jgi:superfamily II DNA or RNA helicase